MAGYVSLSTMSKSLDPKQQKTLLVNPEPQQQIHQQNSSTSTDTKTDVSRNIAGSKNNERRVYFAEDGNNRASKTGGNQRNRRNSRQFWMDDAACKACFICESPFTLFKRKHHCRCCGKIFCSNCASKTVDGTEYGYDGYVRVCDECYEFAGKVRDGVDKKKHHTQRIRNHTPKISDSDNGNDTEAMSVATMTDKDEQEEVSNFNDDNALVSTSTGSLSPRERRGAAETLDPVELMTCEEENIEDYLHDRPRSHLLPGRARSTSGDQLLLKKQLPSRSKSFKLAQRNDTSKVHETVDQLRKEHETKIGLEMGDMESTVRVQKDMFTKRLDQVVKRLVRREISQLREKRPSIILTKEVQDQWCSELARISKQFCNSVRPYIMNFDSYCKLVSIPGGSISESSFLNGIISSNNVVNRLMRQHIVRPRIMLLSSAIEFLREKSRISSLDTLREQEQQYMELVVRKITSVGVDLLLVGNSVSLIAQQLLLAAEVSLVINVPMMLLERTSWLTGALILPTTDHITQISDPCGTCGLWTLRSFSTDLSEGHKSEQLEQTLAVNDRRNKTRTFMFFEGCPPRLGASIYLRGGSAPTLKHMERILTSMITTTYTLRQQNSLFYDIGIVIPEPSSKTAEEERELMASKEFEFTKISIGAKSQMHPAVKRRLVFGTIGSDLSLGDFLRKRCFATSSSGSGGTGSGMINRPVGGSPGNTLSSSPPSSSTAASSQGALGSGGPSSFVHVSSPGGMGATSAGLLQASRVNEEEQDNNEEQRPFAVYQVGTGRVFVFTGTLSKSDSTQSTLREVLMHTRRDYVAKSIRRLHNSGCSQAWAMPIKRHSILTWSECSKCDATTPYRVLSKDAESLSFGRWLQLKFFYKARNMSSLFPDSPTCCKHQIFQDYITYFEYMGQIAGFEHEACVPYEVSLHEGRYKEPALLNKFSQQWLSDTMSNKREELERMISTILKSFLDEKLLLYVARFGDEHTSITARVESLIQVIRDSAVFHSDVLQNKDDLLQLNRVRRELIQLTIDWNDEMEKLSSDIGTQMSRSPSKKKSRNAPMGATALTSLFLDPDAEPSETAEDKGQTNDHQQQEGVETAVRKKRMVSSDSIDSTDSIDKDLIYTVDKMGERCALFTAVVLNDSFILRGRPSLPAGFGGRVVLVYDEEPTSWVAYALNSKDHRQRLFSAAEDCGLLEEFQANAWEKVMDAPNKSSNVLNLRFQDTHSDDKLDLKFGIKVYNPLEFYALRQAYLKLKNERGQIIDPETNFLQSLSRCSTWNATGGKSKSKWFKTRDGRFIAKSISSEELDMFVSTSGNYFKHMARVYANDLPSALMRIFGVYTVTSRESLGQSVHPQLSSQYSSVKVSKRDSEDAEFDLDKHDILGRETSIGSSSADPSPERSFNSQSNSPEKHGNTSIDHTKLRIDTSPPNCSGSSSAVAAKEIKGSSAPKEVKGGNAPKEVKTHFIVLESLFLEDEEFKMKFDLKGNFRNRFVANAKPGDTLMDRNFQAYTNGLPLPLTEDARSALVRAIESDTKFLELAEVVDYSILIGIPGDEGNKLKVGLIDFLQLYNLKKLIESSVKKAGMIAGQLEPTVIDPTGYRTRLIKCLDRYFTAIPKHSHK